MKIKFQLQSPPIFGRSAEAEAHPAAPTASQFHSSDNALAPREYSLGFIKLKIALTPKDVRARERAQLVKSWNAWAKTASRAPEEQRALAVRHMTEWFDLGEPIYTLNLRGFGLRSLPDCLPPGLEKLIVDRNPLTHLPALPESLKELSASDCALVALPARLPRSLRYVVATGNNLAQLPDELPPTLVRLNLTHNRLTAAADSLFGLTPECAVNLEGNPLSDGAVVALEQRCNRADYAGPRILFDMARHRPVLVARSGQGITEWAPDLGPAWQAFEREAGAPEFDRFLHRLAQTPCRGSESFREDARAWLAQLGQDAPLRAHTFAISQGASASCDDRVLLAFNDMKKAQINAEVAGGAFDHQIGRLIDLARGMFRLDQLEKIARQKVARLNFVDEIEVYLAFQVKLKPVLDLPTQVDDMRFFNIACVSDHDLAQATQQVIEAEQAGFLKYLACDWQPWQSVLERVEPTGFAQMNEQLIDAMDAPFQARLAGRLAALGLGHDPDAERLLGVEIKNELALQVQGAYTRDFLSRSGLGSLVQAHTTGAEAGMA